MPFIRSKSGISDVFRGEINKKNALVGFWAEKLRNIRNIYNTLYVCILYAFSLVTSCNIL